MITMLFHVRESFLSFKRNTAQEKFFLKTFLIDFL